MWVEKPQYFLNLLKIFPSIEDIIAEVVVPYDGYDSDDDAPGPDVDCEVFFSKRMLNALNRHKTLKSLYIIGNADLFDGNFLKRLVDHPVSLHKNISFEKASFDFSISHLYHDVSEDDIFALIPTFIRAWNENRLRVKQLNLLEVSPAYLERIFDIDWTPNIPSFHIYFNDAVQLTTEIITQMSTYGIHCMVIFSIRTVDSTTARNDSASDSGDSEAETYTLEDAATFQRPLGQEHADKTTSLSLHSLCVTGALPYLLEEERDWKELELTPMWENDNSVIEHIVLGEFNDNPELWTMPLSDPPEGSQYSAEEYTASSFMVCGHTSLGALIGLLTKLQICLCEILEKYSNLRSFIFSPPENLFEICERIYLNLEKKQTENDVPEGCETLKRYMGVVCVKLKETLPKLEVCAYWCLSCEEKHCAVWEKE